MNNKLKGELKYIVFLMALIIYGFRLLALLDEPKYIEWGSWATEVQAKEETAVETTTESQEAKKTYDVTEWGDVAKGYEEVVDEINKVWGDDNYLGLRIAHCESRFGRDRLHVNKDGSIDISVFKINNKWHSQRGNLLDWKENIRIGYEIFKEQGGRPWVCFNLYSYDW